MSSLLVRIDQRLETPRIIAQACPWDASEVRFSSAFQKNIRSCKFCSAPVNFYHSNWSNETCASCRAACVRRFCLDCQKPFCLHCTVPRKGHKSIFDVLSARSARMCTPAHDDEHLIQLVETRACVEGNADHLNAETFGATDGWSFTACLQANAQISSAKA